MTTPGCYTEMCTYTGPASGAYPGICTNTAGYLANAEISYLNATIGAGASYSSLDDSYSNIYVYDETQLVAYMDDANKQARSQLYQDLNFGGITDWAIDLQGDADELIQACGTVTTTTSPPPICVSSVNTTTCIAGSGDSAHEDLCQFACEYGFCPLPCTCTASGPAVPVPVVPFQEDIFVCPATGLDSSYIDLCAFSCQYGHCPSTYCISSATSVWCDPPLTELGNAQPESSLNENSTCIDLSNGQCSFLLLNDLY
jgi:hypothetical protein